MPKSPAKPGRRQRGHDVLPAGYSWAAGKPIWNPSPSRRRQGWRAVALKDGRGAYLTEGAAIERARAINAAVAAWAAGEPVPWDLAAIAPKDATRHGATAAALNPRSIGVLLDAYMESRQFTDLAPRSQADYRNKLRRFVEVIAGGAAKAEAARAVSIDLLLPPAFGQEGEFEIERAYELLLDEAGDAMANGVLACVSAWLSWCVKKRRVWATNPAQLVSRKSLDGRIVVLEWPEVAGLVAAADAAGYPSIADAIVLAIDLSWSQQDLLALTWGQISDDGHVRHRRIKTGNAGNPRLLALGESRLALIRARWAGEKVRPTHLIVCEKTGGPWVADTFRHTFAEIRAAATRAGHAELAFKQFRDLRDTSITYCEEAGLSLAQICSRTLHSLERAQAVIGKHYGAVRQANADAGADKLDAHFAAMGYTLESPQLALPAPAGGEA